MIDRAARNKLAELIRSFIAGRLTNEEFEDRLCDSKDPAIHAVSFIGIWPLYDDFQEHQLTGEWSLTKEERHEVARWIMFLKTDCEYEWPRRDGWEGLKQDLTWLLTLGRNHEKLEDAGDFCVWPFISRESYWEALSRPIYLSGG